MKKRWLRASALCLALVLTVLAVGALNFDLSGDGKTNVWDLQLLFKKGDTADANEAKDSNYESSGILCLKIAKNAVNAAYKTAEEDQQKNLYPQRKIFKLLGVLYLFRHNYTSVKNQVA